MLISEKLVFVELQKTGSTHIKHLLTELVGGKNNGKHNVPTPEIIASGRQFIGSVRDPWSWYLSLWTYGCQRQGALYSRLTDAKCWAPVLTKLGREADQPFATPGKQAALPVVLGPQRAHDVLYGDPNDAQAFREWLKVVCSPKTRPALERGFDKSPIGKIAGLMTYRYFNLFVKGTAELSNPQMTMDELKAFEASHLLLNHIVRQKSLVEDLLKALDGCGVTLTEEQREWARTYRDRNRSVRPHPQDFYYDQASIDLVSKREQFIVERFAYTAPVVTANAAP